MGAALKRLFGHLGQALILRGRLASLELARERRRLFVLFGWATAAAFFGMMAVIMATFLAMVLFWDDHRLVALGTATGLYAILSVVGMLRFRSVLENLPAMLEETLGVLQKDYECLTEKQDTSES